MTCSNLAALDPAVAVTHCPDHAVIAQHEVGTTVAPCFPDQLVESTPAGSLPGAAVKEHDTSAMVIVLDTAALQQCLHHLGWDAALLHPYPGMSTEGLPQRQFLRVTTSVHGVAC